MVWVRSELVSTLALTCAVISAFLPWNITYSPNVVGGSLLFVRFPFVQVRFAFDIPVAPPMMILDPLSAIEFQRGHSLVTAYQAWALGAGLLAVAILLALAVHVDERPPDAWTTDPVRVVGLLLGVTAVVLSAATYLLFTGPFPGVPIPVGVVFLYAFAGILLFAERV